jgi:hypothetical protein
MTITMKTNHGSRLDINCGYQSDIVTMYGSTYIVVRIYAPLKYIFRFCVDYHWKLVVIGWIFAYIILLYPINKRYKISSIHIISWLTYKYLTLFKVN